MKSFYLYDIKRMLFQDIDQLLLKNCGIKSADMIRFSAKQVTESIFRIDIRINADGMEGRDLTEKGRKSFLFYVMFSSIQAEEMDFMPLLVEPFGYIQHGDGASIAGRVGDAITELQYPHVCFFFGKAY